MLGVRRRVIQQPRQRDRRGDPGGDHQGVGFQLAEASAEVAKVQAAPDGATARVVAILSQLAIVVVVLVGMGIALVKLL